MTTIDMSRPQAVTAPAPATRFHALDGLRGIVALAVVVYHYGDHLGLHWLPSAWIAVDTFFVLSGFVLAHSYARRVEAGMTFLQFARVRLVRLYPLYLVGLALGAADALIEMAAGRLQLSAAEWASTVLAGVLVLPHAVPVPVPMGEDQILTAIFPFNEPAWSLFFELAVNVVFFGWLAARRRWTMVPLIVLALGAYLLLARQLGGLHGGWGVHDFWIGVPRVIFGFFVGVAIYQVHRRLSPALARVGPLFVLVLLVTFARPFRSEAWSLFLFAPLSVLGNASVQPGARMRVVCDWAGRISYPLYITHFPLFRLLWVEGDLRRFGSVGHLVGATLIAVVLAAALALLDERVRERWLTPRRARVTA